MKRLNTYKEFMINEGKTYDYDEVAQSEFGMDYEQLGTGEKEWVRDEIDNMSEMEESEQPLISDKNELIKAITKLIKKSKTAGKQFAELLADMGAGAGAAIREEDEVNEREDHVAYIPNEMLDDFEYELRMDSKINDRDWDSHEYSQGDHKVVYSGRNLKAWKEVTDNWKDEDGVQIGESRENLTEGLKYELESLRDMSSELGAIGRSLSSNNIDDKKIHNEVKAAIKAIQTLTTSIKKQDQ